jgi:hypothetical protein
MGCANTYYGSGYFSPGSCGITPDCCESNYYYYGTYCSTYGAATGVSYCH